MDKQSWAEILKELNELCELHEQGVAEPSKCREFNSHASLFLDRLEGMGAVEMADRMMELLGGCSPKDFSPCDNRLSTKGSLERLMQRVREKMENSI